jgi:predicted RecA/RadA family phage recombinase
MAATTLDRNTRKRGPIKQRVLPLATGAVIPFGVMVSVATPSAGAVNAADTATHIVMGIAAMRADQTLGDTEIVLEQCIALLNHDGSITAANVGQQCTVLDNQTVSLAATTTNDIVAGIIDSVESTTEVWVDQTMAKIGAT